MAHRIAFDCVCDDCNMAVLVFYRLYLGRCEHLNDSEIAAATQSQYRSTQRAERVLSAFSRQLSGESNNRDVDVHEVLELTKRSGFCQKMIDKWDAAAVASMHVSKYF